MRITWEKAEDVAVVSLAGRLDGQNAQTTEKELLAKMEPGSKVTVDAKELEYISSAGLRLLLKLSKKCAGFSVINANLEVFNILDMTGFTKMFTVRRAIREISVAGAKLIGQGTASKVYRLSADQVLKLYAPHKLFTDIEKEKDYAERAFLNGVPTAVSYDVVTCRNYDGSGDAPSAYGIVFELVDAHSLAEAIMASPKELPDLVQKEAALLKKLHSTHFEPGELPRIKDIYNEKVDRLADFLSEGEMSELHGLLDGLPERDTFIHGDFHPKNIMVADGELLLIDMADVSTGHPLFDLAGVYFSCAYLPRNYSEFMPQIIGLDAETALESWRLFPGEYLGQESKEKLAAVEEMAKIFSWVKRLILLPDSVSVPLEVRRQRVENARREFFPAIGEFLRRYEDWLTML